MTEPSTSPQGREQSPVVFLDSKLLRSMDRAASSELMEKIVRHGYKVYNSSTAAQLLKCRKPHVIRYGYLPDAISRKIVSKGGVILSGDL